MSKSILSKGKVAEALEALGSESTVYAPFRNKRGLVEYREVGKGASARDAVLDCKPDTPPKAIIFPQTEVLLTYKKNKEGKFEVAQAKPDEREKVIFGVRPCDAIGIAVMDKVFFGGKFVDPYYKARRERITVFSIACDGPMDSYCFCPSTGGAPAASEGSDVMMYDVGDSFYLEGVTDKGQKALEAMKGVLGRPTAEQESRRDEIVKRSESKEGFSRAVSAESIAKMDTSFDNKYWDDVARRCLSCGACTYYCPTCHCFDINDEKGGERVRTWDSCQFAVFTIHTSGHNPRAIKGQKLRNRYYHKFKYSKDNIGRYLCVGCGRCIALCPASLDITKAISEVK
jgi:sulfhydrogenase subunit beta (sulfur reductase)